MNLENVGRAFARLPDTTAGRARLLGGFAAGVAGVVATSTILRALGRRREVEAREARLDRAVANTFPASDAVSLARGERDTDGGNR